MKRKKELQTWFTYDEGKGVAANTVLTRDEVLVLGRTGAGPIRSYRPESSIRGEFKRSKLANSSVYAC